MKFCQNMLNEIATQLKENTLNYEHSIIIGDNSSGKSLLLKKIITPQTCYFIDAVNRSFHVDKVSNTSIKPPFKSSIVNMRLQEDYFNLVDSFSCYGTQTERVEEIYALYENSLQNLLFELLGEKFVIAEDGVLGEVIFESGRGLLSSGFQALVRILLELLYYQDMGLSENFNSKACIIIDELDEFLSPRNAAAIFPFLCQHFPEMRFVVSSHSIDLVASAADANIIILDDYGYEVLDSNDFSTLSEAALIFSKVFGFSEAQPSSKKADKTDDLLRRLLNNKINSAWSQSDNLLLKQIDVKDLSNSQKIIYKQILEW